MLLLVQPASSIKCWTSYEPSLKTRKAATVIVKFLGGIKIIIFPAQGNTVQGAVSLAIEVGVQNNWSVYKTIIIIIIIILYTDHKIILFLPVRHQCSTIIVGRKFERLSKVSYDKLLQRYRLGGIQRHTGLMIMSVYLQSHYRIWLFFPVEQFIFHFSFKAAKTLEILTGQRCVPLKVDVRKVGWMSNCFILFFIGDII